MRSYEWTVVYLRRRCNLSQGQQAEKLGVICQAINLRENHRELEEMLDILREAVFPKDCSWWTA